MTWWRTALRGADRRDLPLVAVIAGLLVADGLYHAEGELTPAAVVAVALATVPLLWRRSAPQRVLGLVVVGSFACVVTLLPHVAVVLAPMAGAYSVAVSSGRLRAALTAAFIVAVATVGILPYLDEDGASWRDGLSNGVLLLLAVVAGDAVRARRAYREATLAREADQERERRAEALRMVAEERLRIAQEVHDVIAHSMVAINVQAGMASHLLDRDPERTRTALRAIKDASGVALTDLAGALGVLREDDASAPLRPTGGLSGLSELAGPLRGAGIKVEVALVGEAERVPAAVGAAAFRIAQEASTNILRHAGAQRASITVEVGEEAVGVTVEDDGAAMALVGGPVEAGSGNGLRGMSERATTLGGRLDAGRQADGSWRVHAVLPL